MLAGILFLILLTQHITVERQSFYKFLWTLNRSWCEGVGEIWSRIREQRHVVNRIFDWLEELQPGLAPHQGRVTEHWIMLFVRQCVERGPRQPRTHTLSLNLIQSNNMILALFEQLLQLWVVPFFNIAWTRPTSPTLPLPPDHDLNNKFLFELFARRGQHWQSWGRN